MHCFTFFSIFLNDGSILYWGVGVCVEIQSGCTEERQAG